MTLIDKAEALAILAPAPNSKDGLWAKRKKALHDAIAALPARGVGVDVDHAAIREAALKEAAAVCVALSKGLTHYGPEPYNICASSILALIGEART